MDTPPRPVERLGLAATRFLRDLAHVVEHAEITDGQGVPLPFELTMGRCVTTIRETSESRGKVIFIGNGGSAAIASHLATDMWKNGKIEALTFNDPSLLTCLSNDCGYESVFSIAIERFARAGDLLVALSSSGRSVNILRGVEAARVAGCRIITLSGFKPDNALRGLGDINFYVASHVYGIVESAHLALLHSILDAHMGYPTEHSEEYRQQAVTDGLSTTLETVSPSTPRIASSWTDGQGSRGRKAPERNEIPASLPTIQK